ncbi:uncharacterized protein JCM6883_001021 [Sporobolomyces salmoneus]|uniref:uncharacterized protein n=1 Tax=Sporobolomyces salmoneus TaxID=183962 RepID=UPI00316DD440
MSNSGRIMSGDAISPPPPRSLPLPLSQAAHSLEQSAQQTELTPEEWEQVASSAKTIADGLRSHELRTSLGTETKAIPSIGKLMERGIDGSVKVKMELCRVVGNACFDHDENRQIVLDSNIPLLISKIIDFVTLSSDGQVDNGRKALLIDELKMMRAAVGAMLNSSLKFHPIRKELARPEILRSLLSLVDNRPNSASAKPVYFVGMHTLRPRELNVVEEEWDERLELGETIAGWTMNVLEDVLSEDNSRFPSEEGIPILASILLSIPISPSTSALQPTELLPSLSELAIESNDQDDDEEEDSHLDTCIELLSISSSLLESLTLAHDVHKQTISLSSYSDDSPSLLSQLIEFIEYASPPSEWTRTPKEKQRLEKTFEVVKASTVRAIVEGMNDDNVMHELWRVGGSAGTGKGGNWLIDKLVGWLEEGANGRTREDLMVCASHMLAGLGRSDEYVESLVHDYQLEGLLASIIEARVPAALAPPPPTQPGGGGQAQGRAGENTQILYGVVSLMRHLAIPLRNRPLVSATRILPTISRLLAPSLDIVKPLQMCVVGLLKHLTSSNIPSSLDVISTFETSEESPLDLILALIKRTDELQLRSESTRVLINLVKSLFATSPTSSENEASVAEARETILRNEAVVKAISEQVRLSGKYPVLVNEGIVALSLLSGGAGGERGASIVLSTLLHRDSTDAITTPSASIEQQEDDSSTTVVTRPTPTPSGEPTTSLDMLVSYLSSISPSSTRSAEGSTAKIPPEMISNVCTLLITTIKSATSEHQEEKKEVCEILRATVAAAEEELGKKEGKEWDGVKQGVKALSSVIRE